MILDLLTSNAINDSIAKVLPSKTVSAMLEQLAIEFRALWEENGALKVWHLAILKAKERDIPFNSFRFYGYALEHSISLYEKLLPIDDSIGELPSYTDLLELYEKDAEQARLEWHQNDSIDRAIIELSQHIMNQNK